MRDSPRDAGLRLADVITAVACGGLAIGGALLLPTLLATEPDDVAAPTPTAWWAALVAVAMQAIALLWSRRFPLPVLGGVSAIALLHAALIPGATFSLVTIAVSFAVYWPTLRLRPRALVLALAGVALVIAVAQALNDARSGLPAGPTAILMATLQALAVVGIPLVIGVVARARREATAARDAELLAVTRERDAVVQAAIARERITMSRELHDIAAHHLSGIALLSSAISRQIDIDPDAAKESARRVREQSTVVLDDLRRVIGLLRETGDGARRVETVASLGELIDIRRASGAHIDLVVLTGDHDLGHAVGPLAQLVAWRMVQESLANASNHAPGARVTVEVDDRGTDELVLTVVNDVPRGADAGPGSGFGLVGMRERADLVEGALRYGPTAHGGWEVELRLPREASSKPFADDPDPGDPR